MKRSNESDEPLRKCQRTSLTFSISPVHKFNRQFPNFGQPREISHFSVNFDEEVELNRKFLKFLYNENLGDHLNLDLKLGYKSFMSKEDGPGQISTLLKWFELFFDSKSKYHRWKSDFLCWRGLLAKLLITPYEKSEGWIFKAQKFGGTIFLLEMETQQKIDSRNSKTARADEMSYWGFKFEQYMTTDKVDGHPVTGVPVDSTMSFVSVVRTHLDNHSLIFGGEVDCCTRENVHEYLELKTSRRIDTSRQLNNFNRYKLLKWWTQSFLLGIPRIICGFRDDDGIVGFTETFNTFDIPKLANNPSKHWSGNVCFNFCKDLLQFVKDAIQDDDRVYKFEWYPDGDVHYEVMTDLEVLPQSFKDGFKKNVY